MTYKPIRWMRRLGRLAVAGVEAVVLRYPYFCNRHTSMTGTVAVE